MTIKINQSADRVEPPSIRLYGQKISAPRYNYRGTRELVYPTGPDNPSQAYYKNTGTNKYTDTINTMETTTLLHDGDREYRKRENIIYRGWVEVALIIDSKYNRTRYKALRPTTETGQAKIFFGNGSDGIDSIRTAETYYTLNGKDPVRTKANLYTGKFFIKRNSSGAGHTILKARTYVDGKESPVMKVELMVIRPDETLV